MSLQPFVHVDEALRDRRRGDPVQLSDTEAHHLRTVLRLRPGAQVQLADGAGGTAPARLTDTGFLLMDDAETRRASHPRVAVAQALGKGRKVDDVVRTVTELGADAVTVVAAARSIARLDGAKAARALERWRSIARAACEQSRRRFRPDVVGPTPTRSINEDAGRLLVAHPGERPLPTAVEEFRDAARVTIAVGPEGGWTDAELADLVQVGGVLVGLGPNVLRTEHAAAAAVAVVTASLGRWSETSEI